MENLSLQLDISQMKWYLCIGILKFDPFKNTYKKKAMLLEMQIFLFRSSDIISSNNFLIFDSSFLKKKLNFLNNFGLYQ